MKGGWWFAQSAGALPSFPPPSELRQRADPWSGLVAADFHESRNRRGVTVLETASALKHPPALLHQAIAIFDEQSRLPAAPARVFKNLGIAWQRMETHDPGAWAHAVAAWRRFLELTDGSDPDAATIRQWLQGR